MSGVPSERAQLATSVAEQERVDNELVEVEPEREMVGKRGTAPFRVTWQSLQSAGDALCLAPDSLVN